MPVIVPVIVRRTVRMIVRVVVGVVVAAHGAQHSGPLFRSVAMARPAQAGRPRRPSKDFTSRVYALVRRVPSGRAVSYGGGAAMLGSPRAARGVGTALNALPGDSDVPWWRVVNRNGEISIKGDPALAALQRKLLQREGVRFDARGRLDWERFGWRGPRTR
jgi:methylated-DNA-protein-cysteine methyltransferase-like protein